MKYIRLTEKHLSYEGLEDDGIHLSRDLSRPPIFVNASSNQKSFSLDVALFISWRYLNILALLWLILIIIVPTSIWIQIYSWGDNLIEPLAGLMDGLRHFTMNRIQEGWSHQEELYGVSTIILSIQLLCLILLAITLTLNVGIGSQKIAIDIIKPRLTPKILILLTIFGVVMFFYSSISDHLHLEQSVICILL